MVSDVIGISLKCGEEVCLTNDITFNKSVQIVFNHDESLEVSDTSIITKYVVLTYSSFVQDQLNNNESKVTQCYFLDIISRYQLYIAFKFHKIMVNY